MHKIEIKSGGYSRKNGQLNCIVLFVYAIMITDAIRLFATLLNSQALASAVEPIRNVIYVLILAGYMFFAPNKTRTIYGLAVVAFLCVLGASLLITPALKEYAATLFLLFVSRFLLGFVMISQLDEPVALCKKIAKAAWVLPLYVLLYWMTPHDLSTGSAYSMTFSYNLMLPAVACMIRARQLREKKVVSWLLVAVAVIGVLFFGSRGTLICLALALAFTVFLNGRKSTLGSFVWRILLFVAIALIIVFAESILDWLIKLMPDSRTLRLLGDSEFFWTSNRDVYLIKAEEILKESPFNIYGLAGDTYVYAGKNTFRMELGDHSHNIFLELLVSYGLLIGGILCIWLIYKIIAAFKGIRNNPERKVLCVLFVVTVIPHMLISGSTCQSHYVWLLLGAVVNRATCCRQQIQRFN